jgi:hypothetical protein
MADDLIRQIQQTALATLEGNLANLRNKLKAKYPQATDKQIQQAIDAAIKDLLSD